MKEINSSKMGSDPISVMVGLSGGVDSSVSAALLKEAGFDVTGVFIKVWQPDWIECNWKEERREAMRAAAHLDIPFVTLDLVKEYKQDVIDYMIREYSAGRTPNPDVMCNRYVKFGGFTKWAKGQGADFVATGHYAQIRQLNNSGTEQLNNSKIGEKGLPRHAFAPDNFDETQFSLLAGVDKNKDQSYFLWTLNQNDLPHILFPVGHLTKPEVRKLALKFGLPNAEKKDSQGLCFIGKVDVKEFLSHYIKSVSGNVLNENGEVIGHHPGALLFTKGERRGFTLTVKTPHDAPYFVISKNVEKNTITVSNRDIAGVLPGASKTVKITNVNWVKWGQAPFSSATSPSESIKSLAPLNDKKMVADPIFPFQARSRYRQPLQNIRFISASDSEAVLEFEEPQDTLTPGQSLVIYNGEECVGGGVIEWGYEEMGGNLMALANI
jgi:tRNA-specific 2-thiouridylase